VGGCRQSSEKAWRERRGPPSGSAAVWQTSDRREPEGGRASTVMKRLGGCAAAGSLLPDAHVRSADGAECGARGQSDGAASNQITPQSALPNSASRGGVPIHASRAAKVNVAFGNRQVR
jgi:hypothetical protein